MDDGPGRPCETAKEDLEDVLASPVGGKSLLALARDPLTRPAALCYAHIANHLCQMHCGSVHGYLMNYGQASLADIAKQVRAGGKRYFTAIGFDELLAQLSFLRKVGQL